MNDKKHEFDPALPYVVEHLGQMVARFSDSVTAERFVEGQRPGAYKVVDTRPRKIPEDAQFLVWMTDATGSWETAVRASEKTWWHRGAKRRGERAIRSIRRQEADRARRDATARRVTGYDDEEVRRG